MTKRIHQGELLNKLYCEEQLLYQPSSLFIQSFIVCMNKKISLKIFKHCCNQLKKEVFKYQKYFIEEHISNTNQEDWYGNLSTFRRAECKNFSLIEI